jgi:alpha-L-rhamnosidase
MTTGVPVLDRESHIAPGGDGRSLPLPRRLWWPWDEPAAQVTFEREFTLAASIEATLYLTASGPTTVWLDGELLPPPAAATAPGALPLWRTMVRFPIALSAGVHRLVLEACDGGQRQPFVLACLDWEDGAGPKRIATGAGWTMRRSGATASASPPLEAWAFDGVWAEPWGMPCNAPDDFCRLTTGWQRMEDEALGRTRATCYGGHAPAGAHASCEADGTLVLVPAVPFAAAPPVLPGARQGLEWYRVREAHARVSNSWLDLFERRAPHVQFDAGAETFARVKLRLREGGPAIVAITTGESRQETARYDRRVTDIVTLQDGETFATSPTGFRYVKVTALSAGGERIVLDPVLLQHIRYPVEARGSFRCSDEQLNAVWDACVRTVHLCMQTEMWDGIKRDQLPWMGDLFVEALVAYHAFGDARLARRTYAVLGELGPAPPRPLARQQSPGLRAIWRSASGDINDIPTYTLWWLVGLADYVRYTGDTTLLQELAPELESTVAHVAARVEADGIWRAREGWDLVDWSPLTAPERLQFTHLLAYQALALGLALLGQGEPGHDPLLRRMAAAAREQWGQNGWRGLGPSHHVTAMAIRSGIMAPDEAAALFRRALAPDPPARMTYWHRYADLDAAARIGAVGWGLDYIRRHWGPAIDAGLTTLWETFDPTWLEDDDPHALTVVGSETARYGGYETSLCHGWSAGPAPWLHRAVLGITPRADGCAAIRFAPALGDLAWAEGTVPTPYGPIDVTLRRTGPEQVALLTYPPAVTVEIPHAVRAAWQITLTPQQDPADQG